VQLFPSGSFYTILHGGSDDPIYQSDSNGWTARAAENGFIVTSPAYPGPTGYSDDVPAATVNSVKDR
jgi:poly(3-hydroxybutyrate) depolymerase